MFGVWFASFLDSLGITDKRLVFHSFRHSYRLACRAAGVQDSTADALLGHRTPGLGSRYGGLPPLKVLSETVERLSFPALEKLAQAAT